MKIRGKTLIERNIQTLFEEGFKDVIVTLRPDTPEIEDFLAGHCTELAMQAGAQLRWMKEDVPLGTIGAARIAIGDYEQILIVNVDNITTLPLRRFVEFHCHRKAALTIASHVEPFRIPFGQLVVMGDEIEEYLEKPSIAVRISSGTYVLSKDATAMIEPNRRCDITHLFATLKSNHMTVVAFPHEHSWFDINDETTLRRVEDLVSTES